MTPSWKTKPTKPRIGDVRLLFGGRAAYVQLVGSQGRVESAAMYQEIADGLNAAGIRAYLLDIREASYPPSQIADIVARTEWLGRTYPRGRAALWHKGESPYTVKQLVSALQRSGHHAAGIENVLEARRVLLPKPDAGTDLIQEPRRRGAGLF